jgi:PAS domain S-box-containing protein
VVDAPGCSRVLAQKEYLYVPQMGEERNCPLLKPLGVTTYLGTPLKDPEGNILGTLCILNDHPLKDPEQAQRILEIFAARVGAELNRIQVERALANLNAELEIRVQERTQLLEQSQQRFQRLVENVPGAVYQFKLSATGESQVLYISDYITYLLGIAAADIMANSEVILSRIHPNDQSSFEQSIQDSYDHQSRWNWDGRFLHQDGGYRWLRGIAHPTAQLDQSMIWDGILVDITDRKAAEANMNLALKKQRELNEIKSQLITTMSHEFRTPLAVIGSSASILRSFSHQLPEEKKQRHLKTIETYIQHTSQLLEDVLFLNRVNAGRLSFQPTRINLAKFFTDLITEAYLSHGEYPMQFQAELISTVPHCTIQITLPSERNFLDEKTFQEEEWGEVDVKLLRQIFLNLIDNAIKYSTSDRYPIEVNLKLTTNTIILYIGDRGIGIPLEDQEHLFEPFHRGKNVGERSGTGLGLSVVKNCIDLHRGEIKISSDPHGTVFTVILPRHQTYLAVTPE